MSETSGFPLAVPNTRFDQRNEMFKRRTWDPEFVAHGDRLYGQVKYQDRYGYRKLDYALRNAAWNIEYAFAFGNMCGNHGLYSWTRIADKARRFVETDGPVRHAPEANSRIVKKAARFLGADLVGVCHAHENLVTSHEYDLLAGEHRPLALPEGCTHAVVMAVEMDCNHCVMVCPFNKPAGRLHDAVRLCIRRAPALNRAIVRADDLLGYGRQTRDLGHGQDPAVVPKNETL